MANTNDTFNALDALIRRGTAEYEQLVTLRDTLQEAMNAAKESQAIRDAVAQLQQQKDDLVAQVALVQKEYGVKSADAKRAYDALIAKMKEQEAAAQEQLAAVNAQVAESQKALADAKTAADSQAAQLATAAANQKAALEAQHASTLAGHQAQEDEARAKVEVAKAELAQLLKRFG